MDQKTARRLYEEGAILILLNVPEGTEFGIDLKSFNTGERFRGVKMIPPGVHYVFYSSVSSTGDVAPRTGFFHFFRKGEVVAKKWDKAAEGLSSTEISTEEVVRLTDNLRALDFFLGPYPYDILERWKSLTSHISETLITTLNPLSGLIQSAPELESCKDADRPRGNSSIAEPAAPKKSRKSNSEEDFLPQLKIKEGTEMRLTVFPKQSFPEGSSPSEITKYSLDSSYVFEKIVEAHAEPTDILGELEFCYISFLVGHSLEAFDQWKKLFSLFCSCEDAIEKYKDLYNSLLSLVEIQVKEVPEEFLADIVSNNNFVYVKLRYLFRNIRSSDVDFALKSKAEKLRRTISEIYNWDLGHLESEDEDEAPVVVVL